jgi:GNAT superfamily N-acetyltransferase/ketosteroid isomerase-like protein
MKRELSEGFELDDDRERIDISAVHLFLSEESYWAQGRTLEVVRSSVKGAARVIGLYKDDAQIGFARVVSDDLAVAYLADVYVLQEYRGRGLGRALVGEAVDGGSTSAARWLLHSLDAGDLYREFDFDFPSAQLLERSSTSDPLHVEEIRQLEHDFMNAVKERDVDWLDKHLAVEFTLITGRPEVPVRSRGQWLEITMSEYSIRSFTFDEIDVVLHGATAVVRSRYSQIATMGDLDRSASYLMTDSWLWRLKRWQLVARHVSPMESGK